MVPGVRTKSTISPSESSTLSPNGRGKVVTQLSKVRSMGP